MDDLAKRLEEIGERVRLVSVETAALSGQLAKLVELLRNGEAEWHLPIGTDEFPPAAWYVAVFHDPIGQGINGGWYATHGHTGIDLNVDRWPWGDVDRGAPVWAMTAGVVTSRGSSAGWLGSVVVRHDYDGGYLYARYAHLDEGSIAVAVGQEVVAGEQIGVLGDYQRGDGGDHLHLDMAVSEFEWNWWLTQKVAWVDPLPVLRAQFGDEVVDRMVGRGDG